MHYHAEIWMPDTNNTDEAVAAAIEPYRGSWCDGLDVPYFWDWYQIGGRFTGKHIPSYDPRKDLNNFDDQGKLKWPTSWIKFEGDIIALSAVPRGLSCYTLIVEDQAFHTDKWDRIKKVWQKTNFDGLVIPKLDLMGVSAGYLATVDYHS